MQAFDFKLKPLRALGVFIACGVFIAGCAGNAVKPMSQDSNEVSSSQVSSPALASNDSSAKTQTAALSSPQTGVDSSQTSIKSAESDSKTASVTQESAQVSTQKQSAKQTASVEPAQSTFYFGLNKTALAVQDMNILHQHARFLMANPGLVLEINGHTDSTGPRVYNEYLSKQRAEAVAKVLINDGVTRSQLVINALADKKPLADQNDPAKNRRVDLQYDDMDMLSSK